MATLAKWEQRRPDNFYYKVSHLWMQMEDGTVEVCERRQMHDNGQWIEDDENDARPGIHADQWGEDAWGTPSRGYFSAELGIVASHGVLEGKADLIRKLASKFKDAVYYCD